MSERSPGERVWDLERGALGTRALAIVADLGVGGGPRAVAALARDVGADPDVLHRLLQSGGRERDEAQWRELLAAGGFDAVRIQDGLIEARCR